MTELSEQYKAYEHTHLRPKVERPITERQGAVLKYLSDHIKQYGFAPAHRDICRHLGMKSTRSAAVHLRELEAKGAIEIKSGIARAIKVGTCQPVSYS